MSPRISRLVIAVACTAALMGPVVATAQAAPSGVTQQQPPFPGLPQNPKPPVPMVFPNDDTYVITSWDENQQSLHDFSSKRPVFFLFGNRMCGACKEQRAVMEQMAPNQKNFVVAYADTHGNSTLVSKYGVTAAPETVLVWKGQMVEKKVGYPGEKATRTWVNDSIAKLTTPSTPALGG